MTDVKNLTLKQCVEGFLELALLEPDKPPKTQRAQRDNRMQVIGFNRAQEALRHILMTNGNSDQVRKLSEIRNPNQERPIDGPGGIKMWVAG